MRACFPASARIFSTSRAWRRGSSAWTGAGEDRFAVDHRELLVHETVFLVRPSGSQSGNTPHGNLLLFQKFAFGVSIIGVKLAVQDDLDRDAALPRLDQPAG